MDQVLPPPQTASADEFLDINDLTAGEKLARATLLKERGTQRFKDGLFRDAHRDYQQAFKFVVSAAPPENAELIDDAAETDGDAPESRQINDLKCALYLNIAACLQVMMEISLCFFRLCFLPLKLPRLR